MHMQAAFRLVGVVKWKRYMKLEKKIGGTDGEELEGRKEDIDQKHVACV